MARDPAQSHAVRKSKRIFLCARSRDRTVSAWETIRRSELGERLRCQRAASTRLRYDSYGARNVYLAGKSRRNELVQPLLQPENRALLHSNMGQLFESVRETARRI